MQTSTPTSSIAVPTAEAGKKETKRRSLKDYWKGILFVFRNFKFLVDIVDRSEKRYEAECQGVNPIGPPLVIQPAIPDSYNNTSVDAKSTVKINGVGYTITFHNVADRACNVNFGVHYGHTVESHTPEEPLYDGTDYSDIGR